jgi:hypothetical protein
VVEEVAFVMTKGNQKGLYEGDLEDLQKERVSSEVENAS